MPILPQEISRGVVFNRATHDWIACNVGWPHRSRDKVWRYNWQEEQGIKYLEYAEELARKHGTSLVEILRKREDVVSINEARLYMKVSPLVQCPKWHHLTVGPHLPKLSWFIYWWDMYQLCGLPQISGFLASSPWMAWRHKNKYTLFEAARAVGTNRQDYMGLEAGNLLQPASELSERVRGVCGQVVWFKILAWQKLGFSLDRDYLGQHNKDKEI